MKFKKNTFSLIVIGIFFQSSLLAQLVVPLKQLKGVVPFEGNFLFMAKTELSNFEYKEYVNWLHQHGTKEEYEASLPDTTQWIKIMGNNPYGVYYYAHPAYSDFPVLNVSQQQARKYCLWKQDRINELLKSKKSTIEKVIVRLPTKDEWITAARKGLPDNAIFPWEGVSERADKTFRKSYWGQYLLNCMPYFKLTMKYNDGPFITSPVKSYWPNIIGLYNMSGNVAEWVDESGCSKGGAWNQTVYYCRIDVPGLLDGDSSANPSIGFRYVVEIVSVKNQKEIKAFVPFANYFNKNFSQVHAKLYAQKTEISNKEYLQFLMENNDSSLRIQNELWSEFFPYAFYQMYGVHDAYYDYPVVNISYEAATKYCEWLTVKYHQSGKRKYKKVKFRLPTEQEWEETALGGRKNILYPWGSVTYRNSKGEILANFSPREDRFLKMKGSTIYYDYPNGDYSISRDLDGFVLPTFVKSYFPNGIGMYNLSGNAAEMIQEKGISKGGSWNSFSEFIKIKARELYKGPSACVGFRVFMEIIEE